MIQRGMKRAIFLLIFLVLIVGTVGVVYADRDDANGEKGRNEERLKIAEKGEEMRIKISGREANFTRLNNKTLEFIVNKINARTDLNLTVDNLTSGDLRAYLSNGRFAQIRIMPDDASERALERLNLSCDNCSIILKEKGKGDKIKVVYIVEQGDSVKIFGLFSKKIKVKTEVDAENGTISSVKKPWWTFLSRGEKKVIVCHKSNGNESANESRSGITIRIARPALRAHLAHGDFVGLCGNNGTIGNNTNGTIGNNTNSTNLSVGINLLVPGNNSVYNTAIVPLELTSLNLTSCYYNLDGNGSVEIPACTNATLNKTINVTEGNNSIYLIGNNNNISVNSSTHWFSIILPEINQSSNQTENNNTNSS